MESELAMLAKAASSEGKTARLVYADKLDEAGDVEVACPECVRGYVGSPVVVGEGGRLMALDLGGYGPARCDYCLGAGCIIQRNHVAAALQRVLAEPHDDRHRLNYADSCEAAGQKERAEFVRVQVELAAHECSAVSPFQVHAPSPSNGPCQGCVRVKALRKRERGLLTDARPSLLASLPASEPRWAFYLSRQGREFDDGWTFGMSRGFADRLTLPAADWLAHGDAITAAHPIEHVRLTTLMWYQSRGRELLAFATGDGARVYYPTGRTVAIAEGEPLTCGSALRAAWPGIAFESPEAISAQFDAHTQAQREDILRAVRGDPPPAE